MNDSDSEVLFDSLASEYSSVAKLNVGLVDGNNDYLNRYKVQIAADIAPASMNILDYGCGIGLSLPYFRSFFPKAKLTAYDPSEKSLEIVLQRDTRINIIGNKSNLNDHTFDLIFVSCVLHHIQPSTLQNSLEFIMNLVRPGGSILFFEHNPLNPLTQLVVANSPIDKDATLIRRSKLIKLLKLIDPTIQIYSRYTVFFPSFLNLLRPLEDKYLGGCPIGAQFFVKATKEYR